MNIRSTHANFSVDDLETAKEFYTDLGLGVVHEYPGGIMLESPSGSRVEIYQKDDHMPWNATVFGIEVDNLETALDELQDRGIPIEPVQGTDENGIYRQGDSQAVWIRDPASNWVRISTGQM